MNLVDTMGLIGIFFVQHGIAANVDFLRDSLSALQSVLSRTVPEEAGLAPPPPAAVNPPYRAQLSPSADVSPTAPSSPNLDETSPSSSEHAMVRTPSQSVLPGTRTLQARASQNSLSQAHYRAHFKGATGGQPWQAEARQTNFSQSAMSPLLMDIANSTATATALAKNHDEVMHQQHFSPRTSIPADRDATVISQPNWQSSEVQETLQSAQSFITSIRECVSHATHITNNVLDLSRLEAGKVELLNDIVHPARVASLAIDMMSARAQEKDIEIRLDAPEEGILIKGDGTRLAQVFLNLLSNAIKVSSRSPLA